VSTIAAGFLALWAGNKLRQVTLWAVGMGRAIWNWAAGLVAVDGVLEGLPAVLARIAGSTLFKAGLGYFGALLWPSEGAPDWEKNIEAARNKRMKQEGQTKWDKWVEQGMTGEMPEGTAIPKEVWDKLPQHMQRHFQEATPEQRGAILRDVVPHPGAP